MKKLVLALSVLMSFAVCSQAIASENNWQNELLSKGCGGCPVEKPKTDCGCPESKVKNPCEENRCQTCHDMANNFSDCWDKKAEEIYCRLNLNTCQRSEAQAIEDRHRDSIEDSKDKLKDDHKCLCRILNEGCLDKSAVRAQEKTIKADIKEIKSKVKCMDKDFKAILEGDQKSEYRKIKREMKYKAKKSMKYCCKPCCNK